MRFIVDESTGPTVAGWLTEKGNDVFSVYDQDRGSDDIKILKRAYAENRIVITNDKGFGELAYKLGLPHKGVILLRLDDERAKAKIACLENLLNSYSDKLKNNFVVVTEKSIRIIKQ